jgi:TonB family protein
MSISTCRFILIYCFAGCLADCQSISYSNPKNVTRAYAQDQERKTQADTSCFKPDKEKPKTRFSIRNADKHVINKPNPKYPDEAKEKGLTGTVRVDIVIEASSGEIEWAKIRSGHKLLQDAVREVVCQVRFKPTHYTGQLIIKVSGFLIYKFE